MASSLIVAANVAIHAAVNGVVRKADVPAEVAAARRLAHAVYRLRLGRANPGWTGREAELIARLFGATTVRLEDMIDGGGNDEAARFAAAFRAEIELLHGGIPASLEDLTFRALAGALSRRAPEVLEETASDGARGRIVIADGASPDIGALVAAAAAGPVPSLVVVAGPRQRRAAESALAARRAAAPVVEMPEAFAGGRFDAGLLEQRLLDERAGAFRVNGFSSIEIVSPGGVTVDLSACRTDRMRLAELIITELAGSAIRAVRLTAAQRERLAVVARAIAVKA